MTPPANRGQQTRAHHVELAQRILDLVGEARMKKGSRLAEQWIATQCRVSRTPVRAALQLLARQGIAEYRPGEGHRLAVDPRTAPDVDSRLPEPPEEILFSAVIRDRAARRLPKTLTVSALTRRYRAPRATVQKVLQSLAEHQLVERAPGQRWVFRPNLDSADAVAESYRYRLLLEPAALEHPGFSVDGPRLASLRATLESLLEMPAGRLDVRLFFESDHELHDTVARGCANRFIGDTLIHHQRLRRLSGSPAQPNLHRLREATREHLGIINEIEGGRMEVAADLMRIHLRLAGEQRPKMAHWGAPAAFRGIGDGR